MPTVRDILASKGDKVHSIDASASVYDAVQAMNAHRLGALIVMDKDRIAGIFTERDVLRRVVAADLDTRKTAVNEVMTRELIFCMPDADLDEVSTIMTRRRVRHLPVSEDGKLLGVISIGDVNAANNSHQEAHITFLNEYIYGRA